MTSVEIKRAGPITEGEVDLSPLTVLTGENGSGKSYAAMILHSLSRDDDFVEQLPFMLADSVEEELPEEDFEVFEETVFQLKNEGCARISEDTFNMLVQTYFKFRFENQFNDSIESVFATDITDLIKEGHRSIRIDITSNLGYSRLTCFSSYDGLELKDYPKVEGNPLLVTKEYEERESLRPDSDGPVISVELPSIENHVGGPVSLLMVSVFRHLQKQLDLRYTSSSYYLPAGRAGLLQSHEVLTKGAFDRLSRVGLEPIDVPAFSGVVSSYLRQIVELSSSSEGELAHLADQLEEETLDGTIRVEQQSDRPHPEITFEQSDKEFQLHLASTSVSELAPLILYTRYVLSEDSTVIIEEPEAHLHPENQRRVAYFIAKLVREGVRVIVTTHSDFFIEQLNNCIRMSRVDDDIVEEQELETIPEVKSGEVSLQTFKPDGNGGYKIEQSEITSVDGIPTAEFDRVSDELYGESYKIDKLLEKSINR